MRAKQLVQLQEAAATTFRLVRAMQLTVAPLNADLRFASDWWAKDKSKQFWRRTVIRCLLALLEAVLWNMKYVAPKVAAVSEMELSARELEFAEDRLRPFPTFRRNLAQAFELFAKVHLIEYSINCDDKFNSLCVTYELRNRLMHPRQPFDPNVSDKNMDDALRGTQWFHQEFDKLMRACDAKTDKMIAEGANRKR